MAIENVRHPIKDTVKADNSTYSSNKIESLIHSATELPETGIEDAGDVLMVNDEGEWAKGEIIIPQEVPTPTSENIGKVVTVVSDGDEGAEYSLENAPTEVPVPAVADSGKVISVNASGEYELKTPAKADFDSYEVKKTAGVSTYNLMDTTVRGDELLNYFKRTYLQVLDADTMNTILLRGEMIYNNPLPTVRYSAITYVNSHVYYKYMDIDITASAPLRGIVFNSVTIL